MPTYPSGKQVLPYGATFQAFGGNGTTGCLGGRAKDFFCSGSGVREDTMKRCGQQELDDGMGE